MTSILPLMALSSLFLACGSNTLIAEISPQAPSTQDDLALSVDDSAIEVSSVTWTVNGKAQPGLDDSQVVPATLTEKGEVWEASVSAGRASFSVSTTIVNTAPSAESASITPESPGAGDTLSCEAAGFSDLDNDPAGWQYSWAVNDQVAGEQATLQGGLSMGDQVICTAWPVDADASGPGVSAEVVIGNTPPSILRADILPIAPSTQSELSYQVEAEDIDGDEVSFTVDWRVNGETVHTGPTLDAAFFRREDEVSLTLSPSDGSASGAAVQTRTQIENASPTLVSVGFEPRDPDSTDRIRAVVAAVDPDGDTLLAEYAWWLNGEQISEGPTLPAGLTVRGDEVQLQVEISDGEFTEFGQLTASITNAAPSEPTLLITPEGGAVSEVDDLVCEMPGPSVDPDGDTLSYSILWTRDGLPYLGPQADSILAGDTVPAALLRAGEDWACMVTAYDGEFSAVSTVSSTILTCSSTVESFVATTSASVDPSDSSAVEEDGISATEHNEAWLLFDLSGLPERSFVTQANLSLHTQSSGVQGSPSLHVMASPASSWSSSTPSVGVSTAVSESSGALSSESWKDFEIDVETWRWEQALNTETSSLGISSGGQAEAWAKFYDESESGKEPTLTLTLTTCE